MSFNKLPTELLEQISEDLDVPRERGELLLTIRRAECPDFPSSTAGAQRLRALALTCRSTVGSALRELYRNPLRPWGVSNAHSANLLLRTLSTNPHRAKSVRHLRLFDVVIEYDKTSVAGDLSVDEWQEQIIKVCSEVDHLFLHLLDVEMATNLAHLVAMLPHILSVDVRVPSRSTAFPLSLVTAWSTSYELTGASHPRLTLVLWTAPRPGVPFGPRPLYSVKDLTLHVSAFMAGVADSFLPSSLDSLTSLAIHDTAYFRYPDHLAYIMSQIETAPLRRFVYAGDVGMCIKRCTAANWDEYCSTSIILPNAVFTSLPHVTHLSVLSSNGMSVAKLALLAQHSPFLRVLNLRDTVWSYAPEDLLNDGDGPSRAEGEIIDVLQRMSKLDKVDLGVFPVVKDEGKLAHLFQYCRSTGIRMDWQEVQPGEEE